MRSLLDLSRRRSITVRDLIRLGTSLLAKAGLVYQNSLGSAMADAKYLTYFGLDLPYFEALFLQAQVTEPEAAEVLSLFEQRIVRRVSVQYISHEAFYCGYRFYVNEDVLCLRSIMNEFYDDLLRQVAWENERVLDLCCGSGCIGISLALKRPSLQVDLADVSPKALKVAQTNVDRYEIGDRVRCVQSDLFSKLDGPYSLIISNPPYVATAGYEALAPEYKNEPRMALDGGADGLKIVSPILREAQRFLTPRGTLMVEVGYPAEKVLKSKFPGVPFNWWRTKPEATSGVFSLRNGYRLP